MEQNRLLRVLGPEKGFGGVSIVETFTRVSSIDLTGRASGSFIRPNLGWVGLPVRGGRPEGRHETSVSVEVSQNQRW